MVFVTDPDDLDRFQVAVNPNTERISIRGLGAPDADFGNIPTFNTGTGVNGTTEVITTDAAHGLETGESVFYDDDGGSQDVGLTDLTRYWVNVITTTTLSMHTSQADAIADTGRVDLTSGGAETHLLRTGVVTTAAVTFASGDAGLTAVTKVTFDTQDLSTVVANDDLTIVSGADIGHYTIASVDDTNDFVIINETLAGGDNLVTNGEFDSGASWDVTNAQWAIAGGTLDGTTVTASDFAFQNLANNPLLDSTVYEVTFEISTQTSGSIQVDLGGSGGTGGGTNGTSRSSAAVFTERLTTPGTTGQQIAFEQGGVNWTGSIDNVMVTPLVTAKISDGTSDAELVGSEGGTVADGVTLQALYSFLKEEWRTLSDSDMPDLIKFTFPLESITREQFEIGGPTHSNWDFADATTRNLIRTGGWTSLNTSNEIVDIYPGIVTLGSLDSDTQVYFIQTNSFTTNPTDFVLTGTVNQAINAFTVTGGFDSSKIPTGRVTDGTPASAAVDFTAPSTIDGGASVNFVSLGYAVGDKVQIVSADNAANNGLFTIATIVNNAGTNDRMTVTATTLVTDANPTNAILSPITDNRDFLKLFARKKARTYVDAELTDIGVTTIESIVNRFPLSHVTDAAITFDDGSIAGDPANTVFGSVSSALESETEGVLASQGDGTFTLTDAGAAFDTGATEVHPGDTIEITGGDAVAADQIFYEILSVDSGTVVTCFEEPLVGAITTASSADWSSYTRYRSQGDVDGTIADVAGDNVARLTDAGQAFTTDGVTSGDFLVMTAGWDFVQVTIGIQFGTGTTSGDANVFEDGNDSIDFRLDHGFIVGDRVTISGAAGTNNNGTFEIIEIFDGGGTDNAVRVRNTDGTAVTFTNSAGDTAATILNDNFEGIYKVIENADDADASNVTATTIDFQLLDPDDHAPTSATPTEIDYHVLRPGMGLQYRSKIGAPRGPSADTGSDLSYSGATIIRNAGMSERNWSRDNYVIGGNVVLAGAEESGNDGTYIITNITTTSVTDDTLTVITTAGSSPTFTAGDGNDTTVDITGTSGHVRTLNSVRYSFNWRLFGNGGTLAECFQWIQRQLRRGRSGETLTQSDIDRSQLQFRGDISDLLMAFATPTGTTFNMFIDNLAAGDFNNVTKQDINGSSRNFAFIAGVTINLNDNITTSSTNKVVVFFTDPDGTAGSPVLGNEFNTVGALVVNDSPSGQMQVTDTTNSTETFSFDFDNNVQGGRSPAGDTGGGTPVTIVAIATDTAQYVQTTGNILRQSTNIFSLVAALERNYSNT